jgi:hypothetical protein
METIIHDICECPTVHSTSKTRRNILCDEKIINGLQLFCVVGPSCGWDDGKKYPRRLVFTSGLPTLNCMSGRHWVQSPVRAYPRWRNWSWCFDAEPVYVKLGRICEYSDWLGCLVPRTRVLKKEFYLVWWLNVVQPPLFSPQHLKVFLRCWDTLRYYTIGIRKEPACLAVSKHRGDSEGPVTKVYF